MEKRIVSAAIRNKATGVIFSLPNPYRHHNILHTLADTIGKPLRGTENEQGFLTSDGHFVGREEAAEIATTAGQLIAGKLCSPPQLYSEDLW